MTLRECFVESAAVLVAGSLATLLPTPVSAQESPDSTTALESQIAGLRRDVRFADALPIARDLLGMRQADPQSRPYQIADAGRLVATLEFVTALPESAQRELAEAYRLKDQIDARFAGGKYEEALRLAERQFAIRRHYLGAEHHEVAFSLNERGVMLALTGDFASAERLHREALAMRRTTLGAEHPEIAESLHNLASVLADRGDLAGAGPLFREALVMKRGLFGNRHLDVAFSLNALAVHLQIMGDYGAAEPLLREALKIQRDVSGEEHPDVAFSLNNLAWALHSRGDCRG